MINHLLLFGMFCLAMRCVAEFLDSMIEEDEEQDEKLDAVIKELK